MLQMRQRVLLAGAGKLLRLSGESLNPNSFFVLAQADMAQRVEGGGVQIGICRAFSAQSAQSRRPSTGSR